VGDTQTVQPLAPTGLGQKTKDVGKSATKRKWVEKKRNGKKKTSTKPPGGDFRRKLCGWEKKPTGLIKL